MKKVLVTGSNGFIGKNLIIRLNELDIEVVEFAKGDSLVDLTEQLDSIDCIFHLAGINRSAAETDFYAGNVEFTQQLCEWLLETKQSIPILFSSSIQADNETVYGQTKLAAEQQLLNYAASSGASVLIYRLPNVFGKWCKPNYNSVVATFCHNTAADLPLTIHNPDHTLTLTYIDDVITGFIESLTIAKPTDYYDINPTYQCNVGELAKIITDFKTQRSDLTIASVGKGLIRALYATYLSYQSPLQFAYTVPEYTDQRGKFVEVFKTPDYGQFSFFTAGPGIVRGGHYHHTKNEKFLVITGNALFRFRHIATNEYVEFYTDASENRVVETIPGWAHDIKNIGETDLIVMLWANEIFDRQRPDTITWNINQNA